MTWKVKNVSIQCSESEKPANLQMHKLTFLYSVFIGLPLMKKDVKELRKSISHNRSVCRRVFTSVPVNGNLKKKVILDPFLGRDPQV